MGVKYRIGQISSFDDVPAEQLSNPGVSFVLDAFHAQYPGFEGLRHLRELGFAGPVFISGEPAPEEAVEPFAHLHLTGFLPPFERIDASVAAGLIHYKLNYHGDFDLKHFLEDGGRSASERITSINDFNQLIRKLMKFVQRFGVNVEKLKRSVVALSGSHVKTTAKGPSVNAPFRICYGVDASKLMLAVSLDLGGSGTESLNENFVAGLANTRESGKPVTRGHRVDFANGAKAAGNQVLIWGDASGTGAREKEAYLLAALPFSREGTPCIDPYFFAFLEARPSPELSEELAADENVEASRPASGPGVFEPSIAGDLPREFEEDRKAAPTPPPSVRDMLGDDLPMSSFSEPLTEMPAQEPLPPMEGAVLLPEDESAEVVPMVASSALQGELRKAVEDLRKAKAISDAMAADIKRLMKERRQPRTDPELREALAEGVARTTRLQEENRALLEQIEKKDAEIKLLQAQLSRLKAA